MAGYCHDTPVFYPTKEEFSKPFCQYIKKILKKHPDVAMFKVVPPEGWRPRRTPFPKLQKLDIQCPIKQHVIGTRGTYRAVLVEQKPLTAYEFRDIAEDDDHLPPNKERERSDELLERAFWSSVTINPPLYGADTPMSLFDEKLPFGWNLRDLGCLLKRPEMPQVAGVTTPMTYFGMWKSFFAWHVEDADLFSINYLHFGAPKVWYCVSPAHRGKFERMAQSLFPELHKHCNAFMRHKDVLLSPALLKNYGIEYMQAKQEANEFIVLNAGAYHAGYNLGFNCAEAVNFATEEWIDIGRKVVRCKCSALAEGVRISMRLFGCSSGSSASGDEEDSGTEDEESDTGSSSGEDSDEEVEQMETRSRRVSSRCRAKAVDTEKEASSRKRRRSIATDTPSKRSKADTAAVTPSPSPKGPRQTRTSLAAAAAASKMRRTHATAEARAKLAQQRDKVTKRSSSKSGVPPKAGAGKDAGVKKTHLARPAQVYSKAEHLSESLQRAAAAAAVMRARAEAEAAAAAAAAAQQRDGEKAVHQELAAVEEQKEQLQLVEQHLQQQVQAVKQEHSAAATAAAAAATIAAAMGILTRRRSSSSGNVSAAAAVSAPPTPPAAGAHPAAAIAAAPESPRANKAKLLEGSAVETAAAAAPGGAPAGEAPHVIIGEEKGLKYFYMVQVLRDVPAKHRGHLVMRWLKEGRDGLFRPSTETWEEVPGALVSVRTQWVAGKHGTEGGYRLLTLRSRIMETELVD